MRRALVTTISKLKYMTLLLTNKLDALILTEAWLQEMGAESCVKMTPEIQKAELRGVGALPGVKSVQPLPRTERSWQ